MNTIADAAGEFLCSLHDMKGWVGVASYSQLAVTEHVVGRSDNSDRCLAAALDAAESIPAEDRSSRTTAWLSIWEGRMGVGDCDGAIAAALQIPNRKTRADYLAVAYVRAGQTPRSEGLARSLKNPEESASLCLWVVTHLNIGTG